MEVMLASWPVRQLSESTAFGSKPVTDKTKGQQPVLRAGLAARFLEPNHT
jgi:hypothetical protein